MNKEGLQHSGPKSDNTFFAKNFRNVTSQTPTDNFATKKCTFFHKKLSLLYYHPWR